MKIFITGAKGFIGKHLTEYLKRQYPEYELLTPSSKELNLHSELEVEKYINNNKVDIIIHLANKGGGRNTIDMKNVTEYNLRMFFNIVKNHKKVWKIISFGSGAEYSKHKPIVEAKEPDYLKTIPRDEYGFYKWITSKYIEDSNIGNIVQLRIFGCYGEYEDYRYKFITNAIVKNLLKLPIVIFQNVYFDYMYVGDMVKIIDYFIHNKPNYKIYNVTTGKKVDLITLANLINEVSDFKSDIEIIKEGLNNEYTSNNDRLMEELGDFKFTSHREAIKKIRNYFIENFDKIDKETIIEDPFLNKIEKMWKE